MRRIVLVGCVLVLFSSPAMAGGGGVRGGGPCSAFAEGDTVSMLDFCFDGTAHFAPAGVPLTVTNEGGAPHDYTAVDGSFATSLLEGGQATTIEGLEPGIYRVYCTLHGTSTGNGMAGVLVVGDPEPEVMATAAGVTWSPDGPAVDASQRGWAPISAGIATGVALAALAIAIVGLRRTRPGWARAHDQAG